MTMLRHAARPCPQGCDLARGDDPSRTVNRRQQANWACTLLSLPPSEACCAYLLLAFLGTHPELKEVQLAVDRSPRSKVAFVA